MAEPVMHHCTRARAPRLLLATLGGLFACWATGCAQLLDLPNDPQLAPDGRADDAATSVADTVRSPESDGTTPPDQGAGGSRGRGPGAQPAAASGAGANSAAPGNPREPRDGGLVVLDAGAPAEQPAACAGSGNVGPSGRCYVLVSTPLSWDEARLGCLERGDGWDLARIDDETVNAFLFDIVEEDAWIGGSDAESEGRWVWVDDGTPFWSGDGTTGSVIDGAYANWNSDEPNGRQNSDCARLVPRARTGVELATWGDLECFELLASVCEGPGR